MSERTEILRTPEEWLKILRPGYVIADPDGWRMKDAPAFDEPISEAEFGWRFCMCTVRPPSRAFDEEAPLWRCAVCGKWSHAKRRPSHHMRTVVLEEGSECLVPCGNCGSGCGGASDPVVEEVRCGPFEDWIAVKAGGR